MEHTVTEMITGRDLVQAQILIAQGKKLSDPEIAIGSQADVQMRGFAIQCRITTEDAQNGFAPDYGVLKAYRSPGGAGVRLDAGSAYGGAVITPHYDSLLVKVSAWGLRFDAAAHVMSRCLAEFRIRGVKTNIPFLENVMRHPVFLDGRVRHLLHRGATPSSCRCRSKKDRGHQAPQAYLAEVTVNGSPGVARPLRLVGAPRGPAAGGGPDPPAAAPAPGRSSRSAGRRGWPGGCAEQKRLLFTDTTMRDAHQSLLATRVRTHDMLRVAPATARLGAGLFSPGDAGAAPPSTSDALPQGGPLGPAPRAARRRSPTSSSRCCCAAPTPSATPTTPTTWSRSSSTRRPQSGVDVFRVFDSLNWTKGMTVACEAVRKEGKVLEAALCYTGDISDPSRTKYPLAYYVKLAKELERMGAHILAIKDMAGLLKPFAAEQLVKALKQEVGIPIHLHTHDTSGVAAATLLEATRAGVDVVDAALSSLSGLTSQPNLNSLVAVLAGSAVGPEARPGRPAAAGQLLGGGARVLRALRVGPEERHRRGLPPRDPRRPVLQLQAAGGRAGPPRPVGGVQGHVPARSTCSSATSSRSRPSSKVVGDMAMFLVKNDLQPEDLFTEKGARPRLPRVGDRAWPRACWASPTAASRPSCRRSSSRASSPSPTGPASSSSRPTSRPSARRPPTRPARPVDDKALASWLLYPNVFPELARHKEEYSDTSVIPTPVFFYGLEAGQETSLEIEPGKTLIVKLVTVGKLQPDGTRDLYFELNGEGRTVTVRDQAAATGVAARVKADKGNATHVGAPMPGKVVKVNVKAGEQVKAGAVLLVTEAMKMETNIKAKADCTVAEVKFKEGDKVEKEDLLLVLA